MKPWIVISSLSLLTLPLLLGVSQCNEPPPCAEVPMSMNLELDGVLYDEFSGGQMFSNWCTLCANTPEDMVDMSNSEDIQGVVMTDTYQGVDLFVILVSDFQTPYWWYGGVEILAVESAVLESSRKGVPLPLDGVQAVAYYWYDDYFDSPTQPGYVSASGELSFPTVSLVPGGPVKVELSAALEAYVPTARTSSLPAIAPASLHPRL